MQKTKMVLVFSVMILMLAVPLAYGQTASPDTSKPASGGDTWQFRVTPLLWAPQIESKVMVRGYSATVNTYFPDI